MFFFWGGWPNRMTPASNKSPPSPTSNKSPPPSTSRGPLPYRAGLGFKAKVGARPLLMTHPTRAIAPIILQDYLQIRCRGSRVSSYRFLRMRQSHLKCLFVWKLWSFPWFQGPVACHEDLFSLFLNFKIFPLGDVRRRQRSAKPKKLQSAKCVPQVSSPRGAEYGVWWFHRLCFEDSFQDLFEHIPNQNKSKLFKSSKIVPGVLRSCSRRPATLLRWSMRASPGLTASSSRSQVERHIVMNQWWINDESMMNQWWTTNIYNFDRCTIFWRDTLTSCF